MTKLLLHIIQKFRQLYWYLMSPTTRGVRAILLNEDKDIALVEHTYTKGWFLPGGKVKRNESYESALHRELNEELGVKVTSTPKRIGEYKSTHEYKKDTIVVFVIDSFTQTNTKHFEIKTHKFFRPEMLPEEISSGTRRRIEEWMEKRKITNKW